MSWRIYYKERMYQKIKAPHKQLKNTHYKPCIHQKLKKKLKGSVLSKKHSNCYISGKSIQTNVSSLYIYNM